MTLQMEFSKGNEEIEKIKSSLSGVDMELGNLSSSSFESPRKKVKVSEGFEGVPSTAHKESLCLVEPIIGELTAPRSMLDDTQDCRSSSSTSDDSELDGDESENHVGVSSMYYIKRADGLYKNLELFRVEDMTLERNRKSHPNPNFLYAEDGKYNYSTILNDLYMKPGTKSLKREIKLKQLVEKFFSELDKFVCIANYCLKNVEVGDTDEDFNFALSWIRRAFHWLGVDGAKYYANKSPGPYNGWNRDINFLMNRYFFSPEFNHVNGFNIEESIYGSYQFVENANGGFSLAYVPYPGYYDIDNDEKRFCSACDLVLPLHLSLPGNKQSSDK